MKKCLLINIVLAVFLLALIPFGYHHFINGERTYNMIALEEELYTDLITTSLPIVSPYTAARYAVHSDKYELPQDYPKSGNWLVHTEMVHNLFRSDKTWRVTLYSTFMPRYFCIMEFTSNLEWIVENSCYQNGK